VKGIQEYTKNTFCKILTQRSMSESKDITLTQLCHLIRQYSWDSEKRRYTDCPAVEKRLMKRIQEEFFDVTH